MRPPIRSLVRCAVAHALLWPLASRAEPCVVEGTGALPADWQKAVRSLEPVAAADDDCGSVRVRAEEDGARLTLTTRDGRRAERRVATPGELAPTLAALRVTFTESEHQDAQEDDEPGKPLPPAPVLEAKPPDQPAADSGASGAPSGDAETGDRNATLFSLTAGMRGGADSLFSPVFAGAVSLLRSRWELGVIGALDLRYESADGNDSAPRGAGAISAGIFVGRREPAGNVELLGGARLSVAAVFYDENVDEPAGPPVQEPQHGGPAEGRVGVYVGAAFPRRSPVRFRGDIAGDAVVGSSPAVPITPGWAMSALAGVEFRAL